MKVLWVEDQEAVRNMLAIAADKAARSRLPVDLVVASSLLAAEDRLRLERFDLVVLDLVLADSMDADMTVARVANMGLHRIAAVTDCQNRDEAVESAVRCGCNISKQAVSKAAVPFHRFVQRPEAFADFLIEFMPGPDEVQTHKRRRRAA